MSSVRVEIKLHLVLTLIIIIIIKVGSCIRSVSALSFVHLVIIYGDFEGHNHFVNYHGEDCARLAVEQTVHGWAYKRSPLMVILTPFLFFDPVTQVRDLHKVFVDRIACTARWNAFSSKLNGQLQDSNLLVISL